MWTPKVIDTSYGSALMMFDRYDYGLRLCIRLVDQFDLAPIATLTVNLPDEKLEPDEFFVKTYSENEQIAKDCMKTGWFIDTKRRLKKGFVEIEVWKFSEGGKHAVMGL